jgi:hypothetical protein
MPEEIRRRRLDPRQLDKVFDQTLLNEHTEARLLGFGVLHFNRMISDCLRPEFGGHRRAEEAPCSTGSRGPTREMKFEAFDVRLEREKPEIEP